MNFYELSFWPLIKVAMLHGFFFIGKFYCYLTDILVTESTLYLPIRKRNRELLICQYSAKTSL
jgi:hypothetical protein